MHALKTYKKLLLSADAFLVDGAPILLSAKINSGFSKSITRCTGIDFFEETMRDKEINDVVIIAGGTRSSNLPARLDHRKNILIIDDAIHLKKKSFL